MHTYDLTFFTSDMSCFHSSVLKVHKKYLYIITSINTNFPEYFGKSNKYYIVIQPQSYIYFTMSIHFIGDVSVCFILNLQGFTNLFFFFCYDLQCNFYL